MNRLFALLTALFAATAGTVATAQDFPALFKVVNVAPGDWLNIRAEPNARAPIVGRFDRTAVSIEVVGLSEDRHWGLVRTDEGIGWSSMRYLQAERTDSWRDGQQTLTCLGTEPFWTFHIYLPTNGASYDSLADGALTLTTDAPTLPLTIGPYSMAVPFTGARTGMVVIRNGVCSDGMSDRLYGLEGQVYWRGSAQGLSGCCMLGH
ncbi:MAG: hypothetical protein KDK12_05505 [Rhodobacteraceae bacterium]|nr:hypothetical protein [Paracoccaceae bacterium]